MCTIPHYIQLNRDPKTIPWVRSNTSTPHRPELNNDITCTEPTSNPPCVTTVASTPGGELRRLKSNRNRVSGSLGREGCKGRTISSGVLEARFICAE